MCVLIFWLNLDIFQWSWFILMKKWNDSFNFRNDMIQSSWCRQVKQLFEMYLLSGFMHINI